MSGMISAPSLDLVLVAAQRRRRRAQMPTQRQRLAVQAQRRVGRRGGIAPQREPRGDARRRLVELEGQVDLSIRKAAAGSRRGGP